MWYVIAAACVLAGVVGVGLLVLPVWGVLAGFAGSQLVVLVGAGATGRALARGVASCSVDAGTLRVVRTAGTVGARMAA